MNKPSNKKISFVLILGIIFLAVSISVFVFMMNKVVDAESTYRNALNLEADRIAYEGTRKDGEPILEKARTYIPILESYFASSSEVVVFVERLESIGSTTDAVISLNDLKTEVAKKGDLPISSISARMEARGSWEAVMKTLYIIENLPVKSSVQDVSLRKVGDNTGKEPLWILTALITGFGI